ncbi:MAG: RimK family alpha-L-glutamate ligase [Blastocatellia bacterium]
MSLPLRIGILAEARYLAQSQPVGLSAELSAQGHTVTLMDPQKAFYRMGDDEWFAELDVIVGRGRSWALLGLLNWAEASGCLTINRQAAISAVHNKAQMSIALAGSGLPIPETYFATIEQLAQEIPAENYPIILKPIFGDNSRGLLVVNSAAELAAIDWPEPVALAQRYFKTDGYDLKLYGIGNQIWAVRKVSPFNATADMDKAKEGLAEITPELTELGRRCGQLFGLDLFGVDCIETEAGVLIIEINDYPNYTNVPAANERLAEYVVAQTQKHRQD